MSFEVLYPTSHPTFPLLSCVPGMPDESMKRVAQFVMLAVEIACVRPLLAGSMMR